MSAVDTARDAWGEGIPDWIVALAQECDRTSQNRTAKRLGRSASFVSNILRKRYEASLTAAEEVVRGTLMSGMVDCPALGEIGSHVCLKWRRKARQFDNVNSQSVTMYRACNRCPKFTGEDELSPVPRSNQARSF
ncbi:MAG: hypothetical protein ABGX15_01400 [Paracoccaceae bacterium]|jgi:hypothetical protein